MYNNIPYDDKKLNTSYNSNLSHSLFPSNKSNNDLDQSIFDLENRLYALREMSCKLGVKPRNSFLNNSINYIPTAENNNTSFQLSNLNKSYSNKSYNVSITKLNNNNQFKIQKESKSNLNEKIKDIRNFCEIVSGNSYLERQKKNADFVINEFEKFFADILNVIKFLKNENKKLKEIKNHYENGSPKKPKVNIDLNELRQINSNLNYLENEQINENNQFNNMSNNENKIISSILKAKDTAKRWIELKNMNEDIYLLQRMNKNKDLKSQIEINFMQHKINNIRKEMSFYLDNQNINKPNQNEESFLYNYTSNNSFI